MAANGAPPKSAKYTPIGVGFIPEQTVLVDGSLAWDASFDLEFQCYGKLTAIEAVINASAKSGTPSWTFSLQYFDLAAQAWINLLTSGAVTDVSVTQLLIGPYATAVANKSALTVVRNRMRVHGVYTGTPGTDQLPFTISISGT